VQLETVLAGGLWNTHVDSSQLENVILNLAINARDAMPAGGKLTIETSNGHLDDEYAKIHPDAVAGQYVLVTVTDTGIGMSHDVMKKAFDPFFTTKSPGLGTGFGLSQVYGFVKQSGGHVSIYSERGHGTAFKLYLPRSYRDDEVQKPSVLTNAIVYSCPREVILVVEDDEEVREIALETFRELGYTVLSADCGETALHQIDDNPQIDLLFTDIVMPGMNGRDLAKESARRHPGLKILYTSGYMPNAVVHNATLGPREELISKPYSVEQLSEKVRDILGRPSMTVEAIL